MDTRCQLQGNNRYNTLKQSNKTKPKNITRT